MAFDGECEDGTVCCCCGCSGCWDPNDDDDAGGGGVEVAEERSTGVGTRLGGRGAGVSSGATLMMVLFDAVDEDIESGLSEMDDLNEDMMPSLPSS